MLAFTRVALACACRLLVQLLEARRAAPGLAVPVGQLLRVLRVLRGPGDAPARQVDRSDRTPRVYSDTLAVAILTYTYTKTLHSFAVEIYSPRIGRSMLAFLLHLLRRRLRLILPRAACVLRLAPTPTPHFCTRTRAHFCTAALEDTAICCLLRALEH